MLFKTPGLDLEDDSVLDEIHGLRPELASDPVFEQHRGLRRGAG